MCIDRTLGKGIHLSYDTTMEMYSETYKRNTCLHVHVDMVTKSSMITKLYTMYDYNDCMHVT